MQTVVCQHVGHPAGLLDGMAFKTALISAGPTTVLEEPSHEHCMIITYMQQLCISHCTHSMQLCACHVQSGKTLMNQAAELASITSIQK